MTSNNKLREVEIKICTFYFFDKIVNIGSLAPKNIKVDEKYIATLDM